jgi:hypothetical protein
MVTSSEANQLESAEKLPDGAVVRLRSVRHGWEASGSVASLEISRLSVQASPASKPQEAPSP